MSKKVDFATFFLIWSEEQNWKVPDIHWEAVHWLEHRGRLAVLRCFRGFGKSTILAAYNAWRFYSDPTYRILHQGDQDRTALKTSRDTRRVLKKHPLTKDAFKSLRGEASFWWVPDAEDERNPSMQAAGITSNITSSRCDEAQNDDVEVPRNITNPENREKMRYRLGEQIHCMVPGARQLFVGTPHTHDSLYDEMESMGADCLTIKMFTQEWRISDAQKTRYSIPFIPEIVLYSIGKTARGMKPGQDYVLEGNTIVFFRPPGGLVDLYAGSAWPERFTLEEMELRRKRTRTINEWDSQYQLHSRPTHEIRLDPERIQAYECEPEFRQANRITTMWLGGVQITGCSLRWDPSSGKLKSDMSAAIFDLQDGHGRHYWHRALDMKGVMAEVSEDGHRITGGQVMQLCDLIEKFRIPRVTVETNGLGDGASKFLRMALKQRRLNFCGIAEVVASEKKNKRILEALEPLMQSGMLWAHTSVLDGPLWDQMKDWNPATQDQPDDLLDAGAGAVTDQPAKIGSQTVRNEDGPRADDWRPSSGVFEATLEH